VRPENLHVTLKFIGEVPETKLAAIRNALAGVRPDQSVTLDFRGLDFFPNDKHPRVFWAGIEASPNLKTLAADVDRATEKLGIPREQRPFTPHLTLARFEPPGSARRTSLRDPGKRCARFWIGPHQSISSDRKQAKSVWRGVHYARKFSVRGGGGLASHA
jgi:2'-5' RNA ligase